VGIEDWFLSASERGNPDSRLDASHRGGRGWSTGNQARPLVHGARYFTQLCRCLSRVGAGDLVMFTDWQSNADEQLTDDPATTLGAVLIGALDRGADVRVLVWRSHARVLGYSAEDHRSLGALLQAHGADVQLDMRVRANGAHHQKFVVVRHAADPRRDIAFVGGIDLCHTRRDDARHAGDPQGDAIAGEYGDRPPWHDVQVALRGPVVHDVETVFRERWQDGTAVTRNPLRRIRDASAGLDEQNRPLPPQRPAPPPVEGGRHAVQLLRTYPSLGPGWSFDFARGGERSVARGYAKAIGNARRLIYVEDQFLWSTPAARLIVSALHASADLRVIVVLPQFPDQDGWMARDPQLLGRMRAVLPVLRAAPGRVGFYGLENHAGTPVYVHAKVCVIDDVWASIGSDNFCRRSWTNDSELSAAVMDEDPSGPSPYARRLRLTLAAEHLDRLTFEELAEGVDDARLEAVMSDCIEAPDIFDRFAEAADALERWHASGRVGPRPPGRLRRLPDPSLPLLRRLLAAPAYRWLHDPDGRPRAMRRRGAF
jgi:phosphatidylserine/phosphatidylglycerophosphate/cardiolipin synthase-like enzyme